MNEETEMLLAKVIALQVAVVALLQHAHHDVANTVAAIAKEVEADAVASVMPDSVLGELNRSLASLITQVGSRR